MTRIPTLVNILCMKWGDAYPAHYVNYLFGMVVRHLHRPFRFVCLTDDPQGLRQEVEVLPIPPIQVNPPHDKSPWKKLALFHPSLTKVLQGPALFLDLDIVIVNDIDCFFETPAEQDLWIIENWTQLGQGIGNSSVFRFTIGAHEDVYKTYSLDPQAVYRHYSNEQIFLSYHVARTKNLKFWPETWCRSFKRHCLPSWPWYWMRRPVLPQDSKIIVFHGRPKPHEAMVGKHKNLWRSFRPCEWIQEHWYA